MINSGATENFMSNKLTNNHQILELLKQRLYKITIVDGTLLNQDKKIVKKETLPLRTQINSKDLEQIIFDLVLIPHKAILGIL